MSKRTVGNHWKSPICVILKGVQRKEESSSLSTAKILQWSNRKAIRCALNSEWL
ncbi:MAG: hypothetical protein HGJ98_07765 [Desulfosporosinus sp.]|nr:hypothetical protein [Desulfosporosinus sp.]